MTKRPLKTTKGRDRKNVATPLRQSPGDAVEKLARKSGPDVAADVAILVRELGTMIDGARKQVSVAANAALTGLYGTCQRV